MRSLWCAVTVLFTLGVFAQVQPLGESPSIEWQKIHLERELTSRVTNVLVPILKSGEFIVTAQVKLKKLPEPKPASGGGGGGDGKKKAAIRFNDSATAPSGDYVLFSKLGLEAPLYVDGVPGKAEDKSEAGEAAKWHKFIVELRKSTDLFAALESAVIDVRLDNLLDDPTKNTVLELLNGLSLELGSIRAEVRTTFIDMQELKKDLNKKVPAKNRELIEWLGKMGTAIGLVLAVLIFGVLAWLLFNRYAELQKQQMELPREQQQAAKPKAEETPEPTAASLHPGTAPSAAKDDEEGVRRFQALIGNDLLAAQLLVKRWLNEPSKVATAALNLLVAELRQEELTALIEGLSHEERKNWKKVVGKTLSQADIKTAHKFITLQLVNELLIPNKLSDPGAQELLLKLAPEDAAKFATEKPDVAAILVSVMSAKFLTKMMALMVPEAIEKLMGQGLLVTDEFVHDRIDDFKAALANYVTVRSVSPMLEKIFELLPLASRTTERTLFVALAQSASREVLLDACRAFYPIELMETAPVEVKKKWLAGYPRAKKVELIALSPEVQRVAWLDLVATTPKSREMLVLELEKLTGNRVAYEKLKATADGLWQEYYQHARRETVADLELVKALEPTLSAWVEQLLSQSKNSRAESRLKVVGA